MDTTRTVLLYLILTSALIKGGAGDESNLYDHIVNNLVKNNKVRPRKDHNQPVQVSLDFELIKILSIEEKNQVITLVGFFVAEWHDDHLAWRPGVFGDLQSIVVPPETVWLPDFGLANSAGSFYKSSFLEHFRIRLHYDGRVSWAFGGEMSTVCTLDMTFYPLDLQKCQLQIENWAYNGMEVSLKRRKTYIEMDAYEPNGVWNVVKTEVEQLNHTYVAEGNAHYPEIRFALFMQRKALFYVLNLVVPCGLIITVALAVFWLPADSGEKVSLGVTVLLAFSVFQLVIAEHTPVNSDFTPVLARMVLSIMSLSSISVLTSIWILYLHHKDASTTVPHWIKVLAFKGLAYVLCMQTSVPKIQKEKVAPKPAEPAFTTDDEPNGPRSPCLTTTAFPDLSAILDNLTYITDKMKEQDEEAAVIAEWRAVAKILDRLLFWTSSAAVIIIFVVLVSGQDPEH